MNDTNLINQAREFFEGEGDAWFERNKSRLRIDPNVDGPISILNTVGLLPEHVLEIGATNGYRLEWMRQNWGSQCAGIEPSKAAVEDGNTRYEHVRLSRGLAHELPFAKEALGRVQYDVTDEESKSLVFRRSLFAVADIKKGEKLTANNIRSIRPGYGMPPKLFEDILGLKAAKDISRGTPLMWDLLGG